MEHRQILGQGVHRHSSVATGARKGIADAIQQCSERTPGRAKYCTLRTQGCLYFHSMHLPDMNLLVALNVLLEEGSVVGAARRMHLS
ncbi:UNVERIFIED_CONTAM: hypothetical protein QO022_45460, partial [Pseudomonas aeruginosa]